MGGFELQTFYLQQTYLTHWAIGIDKSELKKSGEKNNRYDKVAHLK